MRNKVIEIGGDVVLQVQTKSELQRRLLEAGRTEKEITAAAGKSGKLVGLSKASYPFHTIAQLLPPNETCTPQLTQK